MPPYRLMSTEKRAMPLLVSSEEFIEEWHSCLKDKARNLSKLLEMTKPFFDNWENMLLEPGAEKDLGYMSFVFLVDGAGFDPIEDIKSWASYLKQTDDLRPTLVRNLLLLLKELRYTSRSAFKAEVFISVMFVRRLLSEFKKTKAPLDFPVEASTFSELAHTDSHPDWLFIKNAKWNRWEGYLLTLYLKGIQNAYELSLQSCIPYTTITREDNNLWHHLNQKYYHQEQ